ncbi:Cupredoxin [Penicillium subrubescens]|uniref:Cupredoxin n=1 Tax=Penicillium subrubescens TaxID=1316194 RepID=UPI002545AEB1|nr:Cupredoxin [Penicillium subrubescens]KAJ5891902.1 Cupredoxin [Penicillium subrubescens]
MAINGSIPGPTIHADWGDHVIVHVTNNLASAKNGSSIHFHGIRQNYTNPNDGVVSITQCPTAPGKTTTYKWAGMARRGIILISGCRPGRVSTANYDVDKGSLFLNDWSHRTVDELYDSAQSSGLPTLDNGLINGTNTGYRFNTSVTAGTSYRFRLINAAIDTHFKCSIDNHTLTVLAMDFVPIEPFNTTVLSIGMGQRYDIVVHATQSTGNDSYWMRAIPQEACSDNDSANNIRGIMYYGNTPSTPPQPHTPTPTAATTCPSPYLPQSASLPYFNASEPVTLGTNSENLFRWKMNGTSMQVEWDNPTLLQIWNNDTNFTNSSGVVELPVPTSSVEQEDDGI